MGSVGKISSPAARLTSTEEDRDRFLESARKATVLDLQVKVTGGDGKVIALTPNQLKGLAAEPAKLSEYGLDANDFFKAIDLAVERRERGAELDLTKRDATSKLYDGIDRNVGDHAQVALAGRSSTEVAAGLGKSFEIKGEGVKAKKIGFWEKLGNILAQIFSRLLVFGWFAPPDTPRDKQLEHNRDNAASIAMAGGPELKKHILSDSEDESKARLEEIIRTANPKADADLIKLTAAEIYSELKAIYENPRISDDKLVDLHSILIRAPKGSFGGNPGDWLRCGLTAENPQQALFDGASTTLEYQAALLLCVPGFSELSFSEQLSLAATVAEELGKGKRFDLVGLSASQEIKALVEKHLLTPSSLQGFGEALEVRAPGLSALPADQRQALVKTLYEGLGKLSEDGRTAFGELIKGHMELGQIKALAELFSSKGADKVTKAEIELYYLAAPLSPNPDVADGHSKGYRKAKGTPFVEGPSIAEADQGPLADCYLVAAMAALAHYSPEALTKVIRKNYDGSYTVTFTNWENRDGKRVAIKESVRVTAEFPKVEYADPTPEKRNEFWAALIEKAYAVWKGSGSYNRIKGGSSAHAMAAISGQLSRSYSFSTTDNKDDIYAAIKAHVEDEPSRAVTLASRPDKGKKVHGVYGWHAYVVFDCYDKDGTKYIKVYNPHGVDDGARTLEQSCLELTMDQFMEAFQNYSVNPSP